MSENQKNVRKFDANFIAAAASAVAAVASLWGIYQTKEIFEIQLKVDSPALYPKVYYEQTENMPSSTALYIDISNTGNKPATNMLISSVYVSDDEKVLSTSTESTGELAPGENPAAMGLWVDVVDKNFSLRNGSRYFVFNLCYTDPILSKKYKKIYYKRWSGDIYDLAGVKVEDKYMWSQVVNENDKKKLDTILLGYHNLLDKKTQQLLSQSCDD